MCDVTVGVGEVVLDCCWSLINVIENCCSRSLRHKVDVFAQKLPSLLDVFLIVAIGGRVRFVYLWRLAVDTDPKGRVLAIGRRTLGGVWWQITIAIVSLLGSHS